MVLRRVLGEQMRFGGAARGERLRKEIQHHRTLRQRRLEIDGRDVAALRRLQRELRRRDTVHQMRLHPMHAVYDQRADDQHGNDREHH